MGDPPWRRWDAHVAALRDATRLRLRSGSSHEALAKARSIVLDTVGCALAGRRANEVRALEAGLAALDPGGFRLPGGPGLCTSAAAQVLAMGATWHEACEGHALAHGRPGVPVIAALLPLALVRGATLGSFLDAVVLGYEVGARAGAWLRIRPGMHVDANWPALGVAAGAARLLGLDAQRIEHAVGIVACQLPASLYLPVRNGCTARNTYLGHSATLGLQAALAAQAGIDAPADALGWYAEHHAAASTDALPAAECYLIRSAYIKPFAAVRHVHYGAVAASQVRQALADNTRGIRRIVLSVYREAIDYCGNRAPRTPIQAQFSVSFGVAAMLRFGDIEPATYEAGRFDDAELRRLEALIEVREDEALTRQQQRGATIEATTAGGRVERSVTRIRGDPEEPLTADEVEAKFLRYASAGVATASCTAFAAAMRNVAVDVPLRDVWRLLDADDPAGAS